MTFSIIIPLYQAEKTVRDCLESLLPALGPKDEILLIDDGSHDRTEAVCQSYINKEPQIRYFYQENRGPSVARNFGFSQAGGDLIIFLDADDIVETLPFTKALELARTSPVEIDIFVSDFYRASRTGCIYDRVFQIKETKEPIYDHLYMEIFLQQKECYWNVWRYIFRRKFLLENGLHFPEGCHCAEDLFFVTSAFLKTQRYAFFHLPYYHYIINDGETLTRKNTLSRISQLMDMLCETEKRLDESDQFPYQQVIQRKLSLEFLTNLPLYWEIRRDERLEAKDIFTRNMWILARSDVALHRGVALLAKVFGVPATAFFLLQAKRLRRKRRERQYRSYERLHVGQSLKGGAHPPKCL